MTYNTISIEFWNRPEVELLKPNARYLLIYLTTACHSILGVIERTNNRIAFETGLPNDEIVEALAQLEDAGLIVNDNGKIFLPDFIESMPQRKSKYVMRAQARQLGMLSSEPIRHAIRERYWYLFSE